MNKKTFWVFALVICLGFGIWMLGFSLLGCGKINLSHPNYPGIIAVFPENNSSLPKLDISITAVFDRTMDPATINASSFTLSSAAGPVSGIVSYDAASRMAILKPSANLIINTTYTAILSNSIRSASNEALESPFSWTFTTSSSTTSGTLDATFGTGGIAVIGGADQCDTIAIDNLGRILVGGVSTQIQGANINTTMTIWRFNPNGTLDVGFGNAGIAKQSSSAAGGRSDSVLHDNASALVSSNNHVWVAGNSNYPGEDANPVAVLWRLDQDGFLDSGFNGSGIMLNPMPSIEGLVQPHSRVTLLTKDNSGRILIAGTITSYASISSTTEVYNMFIWRYNSDGTLDPSFTDGTHEGFVVYPGTADTIRIDTFGKIFVQSITGQSIYVYPSPPALVHTWRLNSNGGIEQISDCEIPITQAPQIFLVDPEGLIYTYSPNLLNNYLQRYHPNGTLDTTFGNNGALSIGSPGGPKDFSVLYAVAFDSTNRILAGSRKSVYVRTENSTDIYRYYLELSRFDSNGDPDNSFGSNEIVAYPDYIPPEGGGGRPPKEIIVDPYGRILVLGQSIQGDAAPVSILCYK
jgi:uncharacterized delta-60 repeat protein